MRLYRYLSAYFFQQQSKRIFLKICQLVITLTYVKNTKQNGGAVVCPLHNKSYTAANQ